MKQSVNPVVMVVSIIVVVAVACFLGFRALAPPHSESSVKSQAEYQNKMAEVQSHQNDNMAKMQERQKNGTSAGYGGYHAPTSTGR